MARLSGLQKEVLHLYKDCLRTVRSKPVDTRAHWRGFIREEFGKYRGLPKKQFNTIEHLIRNGHRKLEMFKNPQIKDVH
ncbi:Succinate dehydrogenase assembly factor 1, mitochondrial [Candida viswanathii]|uniref:Succinate dehydrogenase assembly factor 1, mitochondrial n=1 Tax=Candida viswanathii TaxID=5486 RepID=A0A367Y011_9ASCO|nr:Succinate dehydrogenase assembly factor 1, mitochondrial [Candida viswanathii]